MEAVTPPHRWLTVLRLLSTHGTYHSSVLVTFKPLLWPTVRQSISIRATLELVYPLIFKQSSKQFCGFKELGVPILPSSVSFWVVLEVHTILPHSLTV